MKRTSLKRFLVIAMSPSMAILYAVVANRPATAARSGRQRREITWSIMFISFFLCMIDMLDARVPCRDETWYAEEYYFAFDQSRAPACTVIAISPPQRVAIKFTASLLSHA